MLRPFKKRYVRTATKELSRYGRSRCEQIVAANSCFAGYTETKGWVFPRLNLAPAVVLGMFFDDRFSHSSLLTRNMLLPYAVLFSREQWDIIMISLDVRWSWQMVHFRLVAIDCSIMVTMANETEN